MASPRAQSKRGKKDVKLSCEGEGAFGGGDFEKAKGGKKSGTPSGKEKADDAVYKISHN